MLLTQPTKNLIAATQSKSQTSFVTQPFSDACKTPQNGFAVAMNAITIPQLSMQVCASLRVSNHGANANFCTTLLGIAWNNRSRQFAASTYDGNAFSWESLQAVTVATSLFANSGKSFDSLKRVTWQKKLPQKPTTACATHSELPKPSMQPRAPKRWWTCLWHLASQLTARATCARRRGIDCTSNAASERMPA